MGVQEVTGHTPTEDTNILLLVKHLWHSWSLLCVMNSLPPRVLVHLVDSLPLSSRLLYSLGGSMCSISSPYNLSPQTGLCAALSYSGVLLDEHRKAGVVAFPTTVVMLYRILKKGRDVRRVMEPTAGGHFPGILF